MGTQSFYLLRATATDRCGTVQSQVVTIGVQRLTRVLPVTRAASTSIPVVITEATTIVTMVRVCVLSQNKAKRFEL